MFNTGTKILIVDDMVSMRKLVSKICSELGFTNLMEAGDGSEGWQMVQETRPAIDLIISDWDMPNGSGIDLVKRIRGDQRFSQIPFILLSEETSSPKILEAMKSGIDNYVLKPFTTATLTEKLEATYKKRFG